jgi:hypothetical protein
MKVVMTGDFTKPMAAWMISNTAAVCTIFKFISTSV